ncbi:MAG TPA: sulfatase [Thermoanaerobaculia bacterium]|nr:sulfatase [Thermoanaerobaculia bacterium]
MPALLASALAVAVSASCGPPAPERAPLSGAASGYNVVVVSVDTLRADRLGAWGYQRHPTSPAIDRWVSRGARFENASAPRAITWPSLATLLTGLYPSGHGLVFNGYSLADGQPSLPLLLRAAGYETAAFLANMCQANHQGWDRFECAGGVDRRVNRGALEWLRARSGDRPFLLWAHYFGPHPPYYNGGDLARTRLDPGYQGALTPKKGVLDRVMTEPVPLDDADRRHLDALYDAAVIGTDRWVGELLDEVERVAGLERTLVVLLADHGEDLYQHNDYLYHACSVYESSLHVPLAIVAPSLVPAATVSDLVEIVDLLPTILELLGLAAPSCQHGESLVPLLEAADGEKVAGAPAGSTLTEYGGTEIHTYREGDWKLITNPGGAAPVCMAGVPKDFYPIAERELYDLAADPGEQRDLAAAHPEIVERLERALAARRGGLCAGRPADRQQLDEELRRQLEALGYVPEGGA